MPSQSKIVLKAASGPDSDPTATRPKPRKGTPRVELPVREPNVDAVRAFMRECLIPLLAEEFLRRRQVGIEDAIPTVTPEDPTFEAFDKEGGS